MSDYINRQKAAHTIAQMLWDSGVRLRGDDYSAITQSEDDERDTILMEWLAAFDFDIDVTINMKQLSDLPLGQTIEQFIDAELWAKLEDSDFSGDIDEALYSIQVQDRIDNYQSET